MAADDRQNERSAARSGTRPGTRSAVHERTPAARRLLVRAGAAACLAFPVGFVAWFVAQERTIYFWDLANYWLRCGDLSERFAREPLAALARALGSVGSEPYNELACLPLLPLLRLDGGRVAYATAVAFLYGVPVLLLAAAATRRLASPDTVAPASPDGGSRGLVLLAPLAVGALLPQLWLPVVQGSLDVVGCIPILAILWLLARDPLAPPPRSAIAIGLLLGALPLLRRWYAFFTASFLAVYALALFAAAWRERCRAGFARALRGRARVLATILLAAAVPLLALAGPGGRAVFLRDHLFEHAAYRGSASPWGALARLWTYFGALPLALAGVGLAAALREPRARSLALVVAAQSLVVLFAFAAVQTFGENHFYLLVPAVVVLGALGLIRTLTAIRSRSARPIAAGAAVAAVAMLALDFSAVLLPRTLDRWVARDGPVARFLFGDVVLTPAARPDLDEIVRLARFVAGVGPGSDRIYVLASSPTLNPDLLRNARRSLPGVPDVPDLRARVFPGAHVDRRDGFPHDLLAADVVVAAEPTQTHLAAKEQQVVVVPAAEVRAGETIGRTLRALPEEFRLRGGVVARVYVRERPLLPADVRAFAERLAASHPETPDLLAPRRAIVPGAIATGAAASPLTRATPASRP